IAVLGIVYVVEGGRLFHSHMETPPRENELACRGFIGAAKSRWVTV
ncbi:MAG: hypothetical protein JWL66_1457, partial [Sphingomonadales bacterium]|nr:hypothetical protein [Sphingomonadales bacterium]